MSDGIHSVDMMGRCFNCGQQVGTSLIGCPAEPYLSPREIQLEAEVARLREHIVNLLNIIDHGIPEPSHEGSCGPWVQCDGNCESAAYCAEYIHKAREALATKGEMK